MVGHKKTPIPKTLHPKLFLRFEDAEQGIRIRYARCHAGLSQAEVAKRLGCGQREVSKMERGKLSCPTFSALAFCSVFKPALRYIFEGRDVETYQQYRYTKIDKFGNVKLHG